VRLARERGWILAAPDDSDASIAVVEDVRSFLPVDGARIYLTGHSMGGGAVWKAAVERPDLWAAVAPVSGAWMSVAVPTWSAMGSLPVLSVTASRDFSRAGAERTATAAAKAGVPVTSRVLEGLDHLLVVGASLPEVFAFFERHRR
jgi:dienelactone hydrolase